MRAWTYMWPTTRRPIGCPLDPWSNKCSAVFPHSHRIRPGSKGQRQWFYGYLERMYEIKRLRGLKSSTVWTTGCPRLVYCTEHLEMFRSLTSRNKTEPESRSVFLFFFFSSHVGPVYCLPILLRCLSLSAVSAVDFSRVCRGPLSMLRPNTRQSILYFPTFPADAFQQLFACIHSPQRLLSLS